jgi:hypothetical protein
MHLPKEVTVEVQAGGEAAAEAQVEFRPTGALEGRTLTLLIAHGDRSFTVTVTGTTGSVSVQ